MSTIKLDLRKQLVLDITKKLDMEGQKSEVVLCLDHSGSMLPFHNNGIVKSLLQRVLPLGLAFDDNETVDGFIFHNHSIDIGGIKRTNVDNLDEVIRHGWNMGGTNYAPPLRAIYDKYTERNWLGTPQPRKLPVLVFFVTDGDNYDKEETIKVIRKLRGYAVFIQFMGIGNTTFPFLESLDTLERRDGELDNVGFFKASDLVSITDEDFYNKVLGEYSRWIPQAQLRGFIKA